MQPPKETSVHGKLLPICDRWQKAPPIRGTTSQGEHSSSSPLPKSVFVKAFALKNSLRHRKVRWRELRDRLNIGWNVWHATAYLRTGPRDGIEKVFLRVLGPWRLGTAKQER